MLQKVFAVLLFSLFCPLLKAQYIHSHNDYLQKRPFFEALESNAYSIEVDVILKDNQLYAAHEETEIKEDQTFEDLYLKPLLEIDFLSSVQLLIDIKTEAKPTLDVVIAQIEKYPSLLNSNRVKFLISGNRPIPSEYGNYPSYIWFDHQSLEDLSEINISKVGLLSLPFYKHIAWLGGDELPEQEAIKLKNIMNIAQKHGLCLRFWATPDTPLAWRTFQQMQLDFINTDKPRMCNTFLNQYK